MTEMTTAETKTKLAIKILLYLGLSYLSSSLVDCMLGELLILRTRSSDVYPLILVFVNLHCSLFLLQNTH
jgi:hypothetical protein